MENLRGKKVMFCFVYNEVKYLPDVIEYYKNNGIEAYVIDNMSNDGTWEWLQQNGISSHRFDTNDSFHLRKLQAELMQTIHKVEPSWVVYAAADFYYIAKEKKLSTLIDEVESNGFNKIQMECYLAMNTGEEYGLPLRDYYFYWKKYRNLSLITKYCKEMVMRGDAIVIPNENQIKSEGIMINYGACKTKEESEVKLARRKKSWEEGMSRGYGKHYLEGKEVNWVYDRNTLIDIRNTEIIDYVKQINKSYNDI